MSVLLYSREQWGVCKCGHYDWQHSDFVYGGPDGDEIIGRKDGHGACGCKIDVWDEELEEMVGKNCPCRQFTWVRFEKASWVKEETPANSIKEPFFNMNFPSRMGYNYSSIKRWKKEGKCDVCREIKRPVNRCWSIGTLAKYYDITKTTFWVCMDCWDAMPKGSLKK